MYKNFNNMSTISLNSLQKLCPLTPSKVLLPYVAPLNDNLMKYGVSTPVRLRHFLAQLAKESGGFQFVKELASGEAYDTGALAKKLGNTPEKDGDGQKYKGRGLIQITGADNYKAVSEHIFNDARLLKYPELLEQPLNATLSALWFWQSRKLNELSDRYAAATPEVAVAAITKVVNGGANGLAERIQYYKKAALIF